MSSVIKSHNKKVLSGNVVEYARKGCNCRGGATTCPMRGSCLDKSMIYKAEVTTTTEKRHYYSQTFRTFKDRFYGHQSDLRSQGKADSTTLSKFVWQERSKGEEPEIKWSKLSSAKPYTLGGRSCPLCLAEKTAIAKDNTGEMLNRRRELMNRCLHKESYKLSNFSTSLSTSHHSAFQPHDVLLDVPVHVNYAQLPPVQFVVLLDRVHVKDAQSALVLHNLYFKLKLRDLYKYKGKSVNRIFILKKSKSLSQQ